MYQKIIDIINSKENKLALLTVAKCMHLLDAKCMIKQAWGNVLNRQ